MPDPASDTAILLPETAISAAWAGVAPPRSSWEEVDSLAAEALARRAQWGMSAVARGVPTNPGEDVVRAVRAQVWGVLDDELGGLPLGVAFAASTLGFLGDPAQAGERARVLSSGRWTRVSLQRGHVLVRGPVVSGLTAVRATGRTS